MGNTFGKKKPIVKCKMCAEKNIEPEYFTKIHNNILIAEMQDDIRYDKYGTKINDKKESTIPKFIYKCSNGHKIF